MTALSPASCRNRLYAVGCVPDSIADELLPPTACRRICDAIGHAILTPPEMPANIRGTLPPSAVGQIDSGCF